MTIIMKIAKVGKDKDRTFEFWLTAEVKDSQGEILTIDDAYEDAQAWVKHFGGVMHRGHSNKNVARATHVEQRPYDGPIKEFHGKPAVYGKGYVYKHPNPKKGRILNETWDDIKSKKIVMVSLGGESGEEKEECDDETCEVKTNYVKTDIVYEAALLEDDGVGANPCADIAAHNDMAKEAEKGCAEDIASCVAQLTPKYGKERAEAICASTIMDKSIEESVAMCDSCDRMLTQLVTERGSVNKAIMKFNRMKEEVGMKPKDKDKDGDPAADEKLKVAITEALKPVVDRLDALEKKQEDEDEDEEDTEEKDDEDEESDNKPPKKPPADEEKKIKDAVDRALKERDKAIKDAEKAEADRKKELDAAIEAAQKAQLEKLVEEGHLKKSYTPAPVSDEDKKDFKKKKAEGHEKALEKAWNEGGDTRKLGELIKEGK